MNLPCYCRDNRGESCPRCTEPDTRGVPELCTPYCDRPCTPACEERKRENAS